MTDNARERIAERLITHMRRVNTPVSELQEVAAANYLSGVKETLSLMGIPCGLAWDTIRGYTALTLDGVTFPVPETEASP